MIYTIVAALMVAVAAISAIVILARLNRELTLRAKALEIGDILAAGTIRTQQKTISHLREKVPSRDPKTGRFAKMHCNAQR